MANPILQARTAAKQAAHILPHLKPSMTILDVSCGPGTISLGLAEAVPNGKVIGIDLNPASIKHAQELAIESGSTNATFQVGSAEDLAAFPDASFDVVHEHQLLPYMPKPVEAIREWRRVLKPGGILSLRSCSFITTVPELPGLVAYFTHLPKILSRRGGDVNAGRKHATWLHEAGFDLKNARLDSVAWELSGAEGRMTFAAGAGDRLREPLLALGMATEKECDGIRDAWEEWKGMEEGRVIALDSAVLAWK
nr:hypothetical protein B0A51_06576 [Rachicladosporium sp. CCFEE 5018]